MTEDGIATEDWDRVHELALEVVNSSGEGDIPASEQASRHLVELLDDLQEKYGPLPSLLATRADYLDRFEDREYWYLAAYKQAAERGEAKNLVSISESLASLYAEHLHWRQAAEWVGLLEQHLIVCPDSFDAEQALRIRGLLASHAEAAAEQCVAADEARPRREPRS
jgi:hypothetical protein